jgi:hypothetical protein
MLRAEGRIAFGHSISESSDEIVVFALQGWGPRGAAPRR